MTSSRNRPVRAVPAWRIATLVLLLAGGTATVHLLAATPVHRLLADPSAHRLPGGLPELVGAGCAVALVLCWCWFVTVSVEVLLRLLAGAVRVGPERSATPRHRPRLLRGLVLAVLGLGYAAAPALAGTGTSAGSGCQTSPSAPGLTGLALPDRVETGRPTLPAPPGWTSPGSTSPGSTSPGSTSPGSTSPGSTSGSTDTEVVRVRAGDTLWSLAERRLPAGAAPGRIDHAWRLIARHNRAAVGADPHLILPGTVLRLPALDTATGKDPS